MGRFFGRRFRPPVESLGHDKFRVNLDQEEAELVLGLVHQLRDLLLKGDPDDPRLRRLFPVAYHDDPDRDAEYQRLMREELVASRLSAVEQLDHLLAPIVAGEPEAPVVDHEGVTSLLHSVNALRLILGTLLDVGEEEDPTELPDDHPHLGEHHLYAWLSWLLEWTVSALATR